MNAIDRSSGRAGLVALLALLATIAPASGLAAVAAKSPAVAAKPPAAATAPLRAFTDRLRTAGRAEARLTRTALDPLADVTRTTAGSIALEPPDRMAVSFGAAGERITVRADGGEWIQPSLRQMLTLGPDRAAAAARWWRVLMGADAGGSIVLRPAGRRLYQVTARDAADGEEHRATLLLDAHGLPARLEVDEGLDRPTVYAFRAWSFKAPRGRGDFMIRAPSGFEVVPLD